MQNMETAHLTDELCYLARAAQCSHYARRLWRETSLLDDYRVYHRRLQENLPWYIDTCRLADTSIYGPISEAIIPSERTTNRARHLEPSKKTASSRPARPPVKVRSSRSTLDVEVKCLMGCCEAIDTPRSLAVYLLARHGEWMQYLELPGADKASDTFAEDYLVTEMLSKHPNLPNVTYDKEQAAKTVWLASEAQCAQINQLLLAVENGEACLLPSVERLLNRTRDNVRRILGPLTRRALDKIESEMRFGPGASSSVRGGDVLPSRKIVASWDATPKLYPFVRSLIPQVGGEYMSHDISIKTANEVVFVPKNAKTFRAIAIENHANIFAQLGVGSYMREQLRHATGIDLNRQADVNRARLFLGNIATIDLKSASDTNARKLVEYLLDDDWGLLLDVLRSEYSIFNGEEIRLEKYSSMGNGFTFELETIIFYAIAAASGAIAPSVFGDDIIVADSEGEDVVRALSTLGYEVNQKKTFLTGDFFESCGVDVWRGEDVRPFYLKGKYEAYELALVRILNKIRLYAHRRNRFCGCDRRFLRVWVQIYDLATTARRTGLPKGVGDDGIIRNWDEFAPSRAKRGWEGWSGRAFMVRPTDSSRTSRIGRYTLTLMRGSRVEDASQRYSPDDHRDYALHVSDQLKNVRVFEHGTDFLDREPKRGSVDTKALQRIGNRHVSDWADVGPWF